MSAMICLTDSGTSLFLFPLFRRYTSHYGSPASLLTMPILIVPVPPINSALIPSSFLFAKSCQLRLIVSLDYKYRKIPRLIGNHMYVLINLLRLHSAVLNKPGLFATFDNACF